MILHFYSVSSKTFWILSLYWPCAWTQQKHYFPPNFIFYFWIEKNLSRSPLLLDFFLWGYVKKCTHRIPNIYHSQSKKKLPRVIYDVRFREQKKLTMVREENSSIIWTISSVYFTMLSLLFTKFDSNKFKCLYFSISKTKLLPLNIGLG